MEITPRLEIGVRRIMAWLVDGLLALAWAGLVAGVALLTGPWHLGPVARNVVAFALVIAPVTLALAVADGRGATPGKRGTHLVVVDQDVAVPIGLGRALVRTLVKVTLPWTLGHAAAFELAATADEPGLAPWLVPVVGAAYGLAAWYLVAVFVRRGRTPYDWLAGSVVVRR